MRVVARGLVRRFGETTALAGIDFEVPTGTVTAILGPNGAGKTTAVRILTTLSDADEGQATVAGFDVNTDAHEVRRRIGLAAQDATVDPLLTGRENLVMLGELHQLSREEARARADELLDEFSLADAGDRSFRRTPAACAVASTSRRRWSRGRRCSSSTSRRRASTRARAASCGASSTRWSIAARPCC